MLPARILGHAISLVYLRKRDRCQIPFGVPGISPSPVIQHKGFERESRRILRIVSGRCQPIELFTEIRFTAPADEIEPANLLKPEFVQATRPPGTRPSPYSRGAQTIRRVLEPH